MAATRPTSSNVAPTNTKNDGFAGSVIAAYTKPLRSSRIVGIGHTDAQGPASTANAPSSPTIGRQRINSAHADGLAGCDSPQSGAGPQAAMVPPGVLLSPHETLGVPDVRRDGEHHGPTLLYQFLVHHLPIRQEHVGEESTKAIMRLHIGFDPDGSPRRGQALGCGLRLPAEAHDRGDILAELL